MRVRLGILAGLSAVGLHATVTSAATLLYQWNFDDNGGTGSTVTPNVTPNGLAADGGVLTMATANGSTTTPPAFTAANLYSASGGGVTGLPGDYSFDNSASVSNNPNPGGIAYSTGATTANNANTLNALPNIGLGNTVTAYTLTMWVKPTVAELTVQSRLFEVSTTAATSFDEAAGGLWVGLNGGKVQTGGSSAGNTAILGNSLVANAWNFVSVEVDLAASNVYYDPAMQAAVNQNDSAVLYQGDSTSGVYGVTGEAGFANGTVNFASQGDYVQILNRATNANRAFQGQGDDFRVYSGLLTTSQLQTLSAETVVPEPASAAVIVLGAAGIAARRRFKM